MEGKSLIGKTALVTGAAKRIGRAIALELAAQGANIAAHYRHSAGEAEELRREIESYQVNCWLVQADFAVRTEYESLVDAALDKAGALDILVNSASIFPPSTVHDCTWEDMSASMQINAWAPFYISRSFARKAGRGAIINLLDARIAGLDANHVAYLLSKQALESFTRLMALEFSPGVRVNGVAPGIILPPPATDDRSIKQMIPAVPLKRQGDVREIADAVLFLIKNEYITGQVVYVDGGGHLAGAKEHAHG